MLRKLSALFAGALLCSLSFSQSVPNGGTITTGQVWTAAQWTNAWMSKFDVTGGTLTAPALNNPTITGGVQSAPAITAPTISGGTLTSPTITTPAVTGGTFSSPALTGTPTLNGTALAPAIPAAASFTATGCSNSTLAGGANPVFLIAAGTFTSGISGSCAITLNLPTASHGWACFGSDVTSPTAFIQTTRSVSSCTLSAITANGDIVTFIAVAY